MSFSSIGCLARNEGFAMEGSNIKRVAPLKNNPFPRELHVGIR